MESFLACLCPCLYQQTPTNRPKPQQPPKKKKKSARTVHSKIRTKFTANDFKIVTDEQRNQTRVKAYCCPLCTLYYTRILACCECINFTCFACMSRYELKMYTMKQKLKCPFCASQKAYYCDYELDPHSYFDATTKGFLSKEEREKLEQQMVERQSQQREQKQVKLQSEQMVC